MTDSERNVLRNATLSGSTQRQVIFYVKTGIGGNTYYSTLTKTLTIVNCSPTVTATIEDINTATLEITGSSSSNIVIVKGYSKAKITPTAAAKKGASITSIKVNDTVVSKESIELSGTDKYEVRAYDNRGLVASKDLVGGTDFTFINYIPLTFSGTLERHTPTGNQLDLSFSGNYFNGSFGATDNSLTIKWYWKEKNAAEWTLGGTLVKDTDFVINNNVYHSGTTEKETKISLGNIFDYKKTYEIKIEYSDALLKNNSITLLGRKGKPVYNWGRDFFNINGELRINNTKFIQEEYNELHDKTYSCNYLNNLNNYSTDEVKIGRWYDGKTLYRKVLNIGDYTWDTGTHEFIHGINNLDSVTDLRIHGYLPVYQKWYLNWDNLNNNNWTVDNNKIYIQCTSSGNDFTRVALILEYTKTTG